MSAVAKRHEVFAEVAHRARPVREARSDDQPVSTPVHEQFAVLEQAFSPEPQEQGYPGPVKLAVLFGAPIVLWAGLFAGAAAIIRALI